MVEINALFQWFKETKRDLPWRVSPTPYAVWVSEIMLQQTQVVVVIPYFHRWMKKFPSIQALAGSSAEDVVKSWEGLGYYSRARNLRLGAQEVVEKWGGELPKTVEELRKVRGIGPYTAGAISSFAFHQKAAAVDGNVLRVMARLFAIKESIDTPKIRAEIERMVYALLPDSEPWVIMEALIELGALVCQKQPRCAMCPLQGTCLAALSGEAAALPVRAKRRKTVELTRFVFVVHYQSKVLVKQEQDGNVMAGLYQFPFQETPFSMESREGTLVEELPKVTHQFTHHRAQLIPTVWRAKRPIEKKGCEWIEIDQLTKYPFSAGHRKILQYITRKENAHTTH